MDRYYKHVACWSFVSNSDVRVRKRDLCVIFLCDTLAPTRCYGSGVRTDCRNIERMKLNDTSDYQRCFVCGQRNPFGLQLIFRVKEDAIVADFQPRAEHQGFPGVIHGGIVAAILDEALGRTSVLSQHPEWTMTGRLEIRYRRYVPYGPLLRVRATLGTERRRMIQAKGVITFSDDETAVLAEAQGTFLSLPPAMVDTIMVDYPGLRGFFEE